MKKMYTSYGMVILFFLSLLYVQPTAAQNGKNHKIHNQGNNGNGNGNNGNGNNGNGNNGNGNNGNNGYVNENVSIYLDSLPVIPGVISCDNGPTVQLNGHIVHLAGYTYDYPEVGESTWFYCISSSTSPAISHVMFLDFCGFGNGDSLVEFGTWNSDPVVLNSGSGSPEYGYDGSTGNYGLKFDQGFNDGELRKYYFTIKGNPMLGSDTLLIKAGNGYSTGVVPGPDINCIPGDVTEECENFKYYYLSHSDEDPDSYLYSIDLVDTEASLTLLNSITDFHGHIGYASAEDALYMVSEDGNTLKVYNGNGDYIDTKTIEGLPEPGHVTNVAFNPDNGLLYIGDMNTAELYTIQPQDPSPLTPTLWGSAPISGGDIAFLEGELYLASKLGNTLFKWDGLSWLNVQALPRSVNGIAMTEDNQLIISNFQGNYIYKLDTDGSIIETYDVVVDGVSFTFLNGDLTSGCNSGIIAAPKSMGDNNDKLSTSEASEVDELKARVFPNPVIDKSVLEMSSPFDGKLTVEIYNISGVRVATTFSSDVVADRKYSLILHGNELSNGVYFVRLMSQNQIKVEKFMIAK